MELSNWLIGKNIDTFPLLGLESFSTFVKICGEISKWALDDIGLAGRNNTYKIWVCWQKEGGLDLLRSTVERYKSMQLLLHYININIVEGNQTGLYVKLDWVQNKWVMSYGITDNKKIYKIGEFAYNHSTKLPESEILKYVLDEISDFNSREHFILHCVRGSLNFFDPGYCQRQDPYILNKKCVMSVNGLGNWVNGVMMDDEANKWLETFKKWVATQEWWQMVKLTVKLRKESWMDFIVEIK